MNKIIAYANMALLNRSGNIAVTFALAMVPMLLLAGGGIDFGRAYVVRSALVKALDASTLSVASSSSTDPAVLNARLTEIFTGNYKFSDIAPATTPTMQIDGNNVKTTVSATLPTTFLASIMPSITITVNSGVSKQTSGVEVVLALDTTGSMADNSKLVHLKAAAHSLVATLYGNQQSANSVFVGVVPFTDTVNIGSANSSYLDQTQTLDWGTTSWGGCVIAPNNAHDQDDAYSSNGKWLPYYYPSDNNNLWKVTKTRHGVTTTTYNINSAQGPNLGCNKFPIVPLTNQRAPIDAAIDALQADGSTHINIGLAWAWYAISPEFPFNQGVAYDSPKIKKYIVLMTDGENTISGFSAYGYLSDGKLGTTNQTQAVTTLNNRLINVCNNIKAKGITIFTVALEAPQTAKALLDNCSTPPGRYFEATSSDITSVFNSIGGQISKVKMTQ